MEIKDLKIVFFGTPDFAVASLRRLHEAGCDIAAVVTAPDKPAGRGKHLMASAVKTYALEAGLKVMQPEKLKNPEFVDELRSLGADLFIVIAFRMLPEVVWTMPRLGTFNLHASLLPRYRGAAPINWAVINGDTETGITTFFLKHEIDTGDVIDCRRIDITDSDDAGTVHDRLMELGAELTLDTVRAIAAGTLHTTSQSELTAETGRQPTPAPKIFKETCRIDWTRPAATVRNLVRGLSPYPTAWTEMHGVGADAASLKIFKASLTGIPADAEPGTATVDERGRLMVDCGDEKLQLDEVQAQGRKRMSAADFLRGCRMTEMKLV